LHLSTRDEPVNLSGSLPKTHQHCSPADASCCQSLLLDPDAMISIDLHKRLFLLVTGRGEYAPAFPYHGCALPTELGGQATGPAVRRRHCSCDSLGALSQVGDQETARGMSVRFQGTVTDGTARGPLQRLPGARRRAAAAATQRGWIRMSGPATGQPPPRPPPRQLPRASSLPPLAPPACARHQRRVGLPVAATARAGHGRSAAGAWAASRSARRRMPSRSLRIIGKSPNSNRTTVSSAAPGAERQG